ncbi:ubiquitin conjugating enzyme family protein [Coprinopsis marcescibilis]|uniref:Ubiquitin conjugating enzyme family protein n=1 Tax=Coprinopsis marcescibilis TaxID=230819 RepID=A0A5C3L7V0_COPMA|nr:ubiquitin conjugating enzyme family protein [Coprinopsis marcescibilis]
MDGEISQLMEMGATLAQAKAALKQYKDVMEAAEAIFEGRFDNAKDDDGDVDMESSKPIKAVKRQASESEDEDGSADEMEEDDDEDDFVDYDSDFGETIDKGNGVPDVDPYAGIFYSKERREEVIEIEEEPELYTPTGTNTPLKLLTQGQWMKGCPEKGEQGFLFGLYSQLSEPDFNCPHDCGAKIQRTRGDFFALHSDFLSYIKRLRSVARGKCTRCHSEVCLACREPIGAEKGRATSSSSDPLFHCSDLQGLILGVGLTMLEQVFQDQKEETADSGEQSSRNSKRRKTDSGGDDDVPSVSGIFSMSSSKKSKGGIGYAGDQKEDNSGQIEAQNAQRSKDEKLGKFLGALRVFLPNLHRAGGGQSSDYLVHPTALVHVRRRFNHVCSTLLRNDSLTDMSDRSVLYFELLNWLETISNHEALASMMAMPIMVVASIKSVNTVKSSGQQKGTIRERTIIYEGSSSPRELLEGLAIQARAAMKGLEGNKPQETVSEELTEEQKRMTVEANAKEAVQAQNLSDESQKLLNFCRRILGTIKAIDRSLREVKGDAFVDRLHSSLPKISTTSSESDSKAYRIDSATSDEMTRKIYTDWSMSARFEYCDLSIPSATISEDEPPHYKFFFDAEARTLANSDIPKRSLAIAKELAILTTNLPVAWDSSIFLRVDETRVDIIKALIIGPEGTPYQNGCFLFDIFLGPSYNQSPPNVKYMTTNGGKYRFNPNLYADGKVCLSLLGTWSGPGWISGKSTLLQVLISIQSMILCEEPYLNEPGWASSAGTPQSKAYSANVRRMTVKTAMLGNLKAPPEPFRDIIRTHFRLKAKSVSAQLDDWVRKDDGKQTVGDGGSLSRDSGTVNNGLPKDVEELKGHLQKLQESAK